MSKYIIMTFVLPGQDLVSSLPFDGDEKLMVTKCETEREHWSKNIDTECYTIACEPPQPEIVYQTKNTPADA